MDINRYSELLTKFNKEFMGEVSKDVGNIMLSSLKGIDIGQLLKGISPDMWLKMAGMAGISGFQMPGDSPYKILGLERTASDEEVKQRYRDLLKKIHPDTAGVKGTEFLVAMIVQAYKQIEIERRWK